MNHSDPYERYKQDAQLLSEIGIVLKSQLPSYRVRVPWRLASRAIAAWERDEEGELPAQETELQTSLRHMAGHLALIGLSLKEAGERVQSDYVELDLDPDFIDAAVRASQLVGP
ncbi:hypothetical protein ASE12_06275 [Aeromicrobium sp. Root236]|uniref:hypothetical protein n=1 Tax=Aeromicrobium sp. Root236 TaxID=1736498 RepID=UPI0006FC386B|nr:hypothetical protein [Aeromicrobium sp. Root236]KRC64408.1 hypothetical protein ASE12_06275 [Aeromicrobium sp. Root236]